MEENKSHASVQPQNRNACSVIPRTNCETCVGDLEPHSDCSCAPRSSAPRRHRVEPHLNTALHHVQRSRVPRSTQLMPGCVGLYVECQVLYVCCMCFVVLLSGKLRLRGRACCVRVGGRVGYVIAMMCMFCVRVRASEVCYVCVPQNNEHMPLNTQQQT